jgi:hypothetical protein
MEMRKIISEANFLGTAFLLQVLAAAPISDFYKFLTTARQVYTIF